MESPDSSPNPTGASDDIAIKSLFATLLGAWNRRNATDMAGLFVEAGNMVGFDGSTVNGRADIQSHLAPIFARHPTPAFVHKVREIRILSPRVAMLRAVAGMIRQGQTDIVPALNAIQTMIASKSDDQWRIEMFQNTPAAFHGNAALGEALSEELRAVATRK